MKDALRDLALALALYALFGAILLTVAIVVTDALTGSVLP
jgi:hypothetical protein